MQTLLVEVFWANAQWISGGLTAILLVYTYFTFKYKDTHVKFCYTIATTAAALTTFELFRNNFNFTTGVMAVIATQALLFVAGIHLAQNRDILGTLTITLYLLLDICALKISAYQTASSYPVATIGFASALVAMIFLSIASIVLVVLIVKSVITKRSKPA